MVIIAKSWIIIHGLKLGYRSWLKDRLSFTA